MIALCSSAQLRSWDRYTMDKQPISDFSLMEQASAAFVSAFSERYSTKAPVFVIAGRGNNGGDGLCVARLLKQKDYDVEVLFWGEKPASQSAKQALHLWQKAGGSLTRLKSADELPETSLTKAAICIDALFGTGLTRPLEGTDKALVDRLNQLQLTFVSLDTPSGLLLDKPQHQATAIEASHTISLQSPKRAFFLPENARYVDEWTTVDIGLRPDFLKNTKPDHGYLLEAADIRECLPSRPRHLHKGQAGRALLVAGSRGMYGAALLAARAAMRSGAGAVHVHLPREGVPLLHTSLPEALLQADLHPTYLTQIKIPPKIAALAVGPGLSQQLPTAAALRKLYETTSLPLVVDADALNLMADCTELRRALPANSLLTPHEGELARLTGSWTDDYDKLERLQALAKDTRSTVLLKGAYTAIASPGEPLFFNATGNPGMATAGSGDVLTGLLLALRAAGLSALQAASCGAFLHGLAGDQAALEKGSHGLIASDIIEKLPTAFSSVLGH